MDQHCQQQKVKKAGNNYTIRIRTSGRSSNLSPSGKDKSVPDSDNDKGRGEIGSLFQNIPRTIQFKDNQLVEGRFSYVDEGFEKWKIGKVIGKGNSSVRKAMNVKTGVISAVKQIMFSSDEEEKKLNEIKILKTIRHPNIVSYLEHHKVKNQVWIFMEYVPMNLKKFYREYGPPPFEVFFKFAKQIVEALAYLENNKIIHKDIKCQNILIDNNGTLKLCDFGCSKNFSGTLSLQIYENNGAVKSFKASYLWVAPQCLRGQVYLASDIWSLGCTFLELASGSIPWSEKNFENELQAGMYIEKHDEIPMISESLHPKIRELILCCLKRNHEQRITASQLLARADFWS